MNERIKELAKQSFQKCMDENGFLNNTSWRINPDHYAESEVFEKFAELIVRECAELNFRELGLSGSDSFDVSRMIKQHFGVENA